MVELTDVQMCIKDLAIPADSWDLHHEKISNIYNNIYLISIIKVPSTVIIECLVIGPIQRTYFRIELELNRDLLRMMTIIEAI